MRYWIFLILIIASALLQATVLDVFRIWGVRPDLLLGCLLIGAVFFEPKWALGYAVFAGMLKDVLGISSLGLNTLLFPFWVIVIIALSRKISLEHRLFMVLLLIIISLVNAFIFKLVFLFSNYVPAGIFFRTLILEALYSGLIIYWVFIPVQKYFKTEPDSESDSSLDSDDQEEDDDLLDFEEGQGL